MHRPGRPARPGWPVRPGSRPANDADTVAIFGRWQADDPVGQLRAAREREQQEVETERLAMPHDREPRWTDTAELPAGGGQYPGLPMRRGRQQRVPRRAAGGLALVAIGLVISFGAAAGVYDPIRGIARTVGGLFSPRSSSGLGAGTGAAPTAIFGDSGRAGQKGETTASGPGTGPVSDPPKATATGPGGPAGTGPAPRTGRRADRRSDGGTGGGDRGTGPASGGGPAAR